MIPVLSYLVLSLIMHLFCAHAHTHPDITYTLQNVTGQNCTNKFVDADCCFASINGLRYFDTENILNIDSSTL